MTIVDDMIARVGMYQYQPGRIQADQYAMLTAIRNGDIEIPDASNPFVWLSEISAIHVAAFMEKDAVLDRRQYARNAQLPDDLYYHMSNWDYINQFAKPSTCTFGFLFNLTEILNKLVLDPATGIKKIVIPRNSTVTIAGVVFSMQYPIEIRQMKHGGLQVLYDATQTTPLLTLSTNVIDFQISRQDGADFLYFEVPLTQFFVETRLQDITQASAFTLVKNLTDEYYYTRVWYQDAVTKAWVEMQTTMTPGVMDVTTPTAIIRVVNTQVLVEIPQIYAERGLLQGKIRTDFYQTRGELNMTMSAYQTNQFTAEWMALDKSEMTQFTAPLATLSYATIVGQGITLGGRAALSFEEQRRRVINNATGPINLPITNVQLEEKLLDAGYEMVRNIDNITNRTFLATKPMPQPTNAKLITAAAASIESIRVSMTDLATLDTVVDNGDSLTILPTTLYKNQSGVVRVAPSAEIKALLALPPSQRALAVNQSEYYYTPWHYVLDASGNEFDMRAYYLNSPVAVRTEFIDTNPTTGLQVSTASKYSLVLTPTGYQLQVQVSSGDTYKALSDDQCFVQLAYIPEGENTYAFLKGVFAGIDPDTNERVFTFDLSTTWDVDANDNLALTQFQMFTTASRVVRAPLETTFEILYSTSAVMDSSWTRSDIDTLLGRFQLPDGIVGITHERITLHFGDALTRLWRRARSVIGEIPYKTYTSDEQAFYEQDVYEVGPDGSYIQIVDGQVVYNILHHAGDPILDADGNITYKHRAGDVIVDGSGKPVVGGSRDLQRQVELMMIEGAYYFATDDIAKTYRQEMVDTVLAWLLDELEPLNQVALEETNIYYYPKSTLGDIAVINQSGLNTTIKAGQSFQLNLYVSPLVFANDAVRNQLALSAIRTLNTGVSAVQVTEDSLITSLKTALGDDVLAIDLKGLGGSDMTIFTVYDPSTRCGLKKVLVAQGDDSLIVAEDVAVIFTNYDATQVGT